MVRRMVRWAYIYDLRLHDIGNNVDFGQPAFLSCEAGFMSESDSNENQEQ